MKTFTEIIKDIFKWLVASAGMCCMLMLSNPDTRDVFNGVLSNTVNSEEKSSNGSIGMKIYFADPLMEITQVEKQIR